RSRRTSRCSRKIEPENFPRLGPKAYVPAIRPSVGRACATSIPRPERRVRIDPDGQRAIEMMRWGFPPPPKLGTRPVTNVRNLESSYWHPWLTRAFRCLVPATSFCEYTDSPPKVPHWFALGEDRPLFAFAGIWRPWTGERKKETREH